MRAVLDSLNDRRAWRARDGLRSIGLVACAVTTRRRRAGLRSAATLVGLIGVLVCACSPALAASQRGHAFSFAFGSFESPAGVGVDSATGDVYVADTGHKRVLVYEPVFESGQVTGEKVLRELKVSSPTAIAVDNSTTGGDPSSGDVYVVDKRHAIEKFNAEGQPIETIKQFEVGEAKKKKKFAGIDGLAVDSSGNLFVLQETGQIYELNDATSNEVVSEVLVPGSEVTLSPGFAVDAAGDFYVAAGKEPSESPLQQPLLAEVEAEALAAAGEGSVYANAVKFDGTGKILIPALDYEFASAIAVNPIDEPANQVSERDDAYVVNVAGVGNQKVSTVAEFAAEEGEHETGALIQRFGAPGLSEGDAIAVDSKTGVVYVADAAAGKVDVFGLEPLGAPAIEGLTATSSTTAAGVETLSANVDPRGADTSTYFEYGPESCSQAFACEKTPTSEIAHGFGDQHEAAQLPSLPPGTYHYRVIAQNPDGKVQSGEQTFMIAASLGALPDGRAWEMVSPPDKGGAEPEPIRREGGLVEASASGDAITYVADGPISTNGEIAGNRNPEPTQVLSTADHRPGQEGWFTQDTTTPVETGAGPDPGAPWEYQLFSPTLALALLNPDHGTNGSYESPPLSPLLPGEQAGKQENTIFLRDQEPLSPGASEAANFEQARSNGQLMEPHNAGYLPLVTQLNADSPGGPGVKFGESFEAGRGLEARRRHGGSESRGLQIRTRKRPQRSLRVERRRDRADQCPRKRGRTERRLLCGSLPGR